MRRDVGIAGCLAICQHLALALLFGFALLACSKRDGSHVPVEIAIKTATPVANTPADEPLTAETPLAPGSAREPILATAGRPDDAIESLAADVRDRLRGSMEGIIELDAEFRTPRSIACIDLRSGRTLHQFTPAVLPRRVRLKATAEPMRPNADAQEIVFRITIEVRDEATGAVCGDASMEVALECNLARAVPPAGTWRTTYPAGDPSLPAPKLSAMLSWNRKESLELRSHGPIWAMEPVPFDIWPCPILAVTLLGADLQCALGRSHE